MIIPPINVSSFPRNYLLSRHTQVEMSLLDCPPPPSSFHYLPVDPPVWDLGPMYLLPEAGCWRAQSCTDKHNCLEVKSSTALLCSRDSLHLIPLLHSFGSYSSPFIPCCVPWVLEGVLMSLMAESFVLITLVTYESLQLSLPVLNGTSLTRVDGSIKK